MELSNTSKLVGVKTALSCTLLLESQLLNTEIVLLSNLKGPELLCPEHSNFATEG